LVADYFLRVVLGETDISSAKGKRQAVERLLPVIAAMDSPVERTHYLQRLAQRVRMDERELLPELDRLRSGRGQAAVKATGRPAPTMPSAQANPVRTGLGLEERCLALLLQMPTLLGDVLETTMLSEESFQDIRNRQVLKALQAYLGEQAAFVESDFRSGLDTELAAHVESLLHMLQAGPPLSPEMGREDLMKCSARLQKSHLSRLVRELRFVQQDAHQEGSEERVRQLNEIIERLMRDYRQVEQRFNAATFIGRSKPNSRIPHA
jgi:DNA primase